MRIYEEADEMILKTWMLLPAVLVVVLISGCVNQEGSSANAGSNSSIAAAGNAVSYSANIEKLEVIHFHGTHQCDSCIAVGKYAEETVNTYFKKELESGKITFAHINGELPENLALVEKYGVTSSSLWLGVYDSEGFHPEQDTNVWYKTNDKNAYMEYLKGVIESKLLGL